LIELDRRQRVTLIWAGLAVVLAGFEGSILILALPAIAREFHANIPALSALGSILAIGTLGALPLANLADRYGRRRLIAVGVAGFSLVNFASGFVGSLAGLAFLRLFAVCFEVLVLGVSTALIVEEAPPRSRGQAVSVLALLSGFGTGITVIAYPILAPNWRLLFLVSGVGVLAAPLIWWLLPEGRTWQGVRVTGSALRLLMQPPWRRRILILSAMFALFAVLLEPAGLLYTVYASFVLRWTPAEISILIVVSGTVGAVSYLAGGYLTDRFGRRAPAIALTVATAGATSLSFATGTVGFFVGNVLWSARRRKRRSGWQGRWAALPGCWLWACCRRPPDWVARSSWAASPRSQARCSSSFFLRPSSSRYPSSDCSLSLPDSPDEAM